MDPNLGGFAELDEGSALNGLLTLPTAEGLGESAAGWLTQETPVKQQGLALALLTAAFGRAFQEFAATRAELGDKKQLEAHFAAAVKWALPTSSTESSRPKVVLAELLRHPERSAWYAALWSACTQPALFDPQGRFAEPLIKAAGADEQRLFEQLFRRAVAELLAAPAGRELCQTLLSTSLAAERAQWLELVLLGDQAGWGRRHIFGNVRCHATLPHLALASMYVEPDAARRGCGPAAKPGPIGAAVRTALLDHPLVVVTAEGGCGKSLTARTLACQSARELLGAIDPAAAARLPVPIFITCQPAASGAPFELARETQRARWQSLLELGISGLREADKSLPPTSPRALFLIDSLDDLSLGESGVTAFFDHLRSQLGVDQRAVVFARPQALPMAYLQKWHVPVFHLLPFSTEGESLGQVGEWLRRFSAYSGRPPIDPAALGTGGQLLELAKTPILLFLLAYTWGDRAALYPEWIKAGTVDPDETAWDLRHFLYETFFRALASGKYGPIHDPPLPVFEIDADAASKLHATLAEHGLLSGPQSTPPRGPPHPDGSAERARRTAAILWLLGRIAWEARCLEQEDKPKTLSSWRISQLLASELELIDDTRTLEGVRDGLLRALQADLSSGSRTTLLGHKSFREFLVARCWGTLLHALLAPSCSEERRHALTHVLRRGRLIDLEDRSFDFLRAHLRQWDQSARKRLFRWAEREFRDDRMETSSATLRSDPRREFRKTTLALAAAFAPPEGLELGDGTALRALLASYWTAYQSAHLFAPRVQAAGTRLFNAPLGATNLSHANLRGAELKEADLDGANLSHADLEGADLEGASLTAADLTEAHLARANLEAANLSRAHLMGAQLLGARLLGTNLAHADLTGAQLPGAQLPGANLEGTELSEAILTDANLCQANLWRASLVQVNLARADLEGAHLDEADLSRANLEGANLSRASMEGAHLAEAQLVGAQVLRVNLAHADLEGAHLDEAHLSRANLEGANLSRANLSRANLEGAHLDQAHLCRATLEGANLSRANLEGAHLEGANLVGAHIVRANLAHANLEGAHLEGAHLVGAHLEGAQLSAAHMEGAHLEGAHLEGARLHGTHLAGAHLGKANLNGVDLRKAHMDSRMTELAQEQGALVAPAVLSGPPIPALQSAAALADTQPQRASAAAITQPEGKADTKPENKLASKPGSGAKSDPGSDVDDITIEVVEGIDESGELGRSRPW